MRYVKIAAALLWALSTVLGFATPRVYAQDRMSLALRISEFVKQNRYEEALPVVEQYVELVRQQLGSHHSDYVGGRKLQTMVLVRIAERRDQEGRYRASELAYRRALEIGRLSHPPIFPVSTYSKTTSR